MSKMRVSLNLLTVRSDHELGVERFVRNVIGRVALPVTVDLKLLMPKNASPDKMLGRTFFQRNHRVKISYWRTGPTATRIFIELVALSIVLYRYDKILSANNFGPLFGKPGQRRIIVIHDIWFYSDGYEGSWSSMLLFKGLIWLQIKASHHIVTVSDFTKRAIVEKLRIDPAMISVVPNCVNPADEPPPAPPVKEPLPPGEFFLLVGSDRANKNVERAVNAFCNYSRKDKRCIPMVIVGSYSEEYWERFGADDVELIGTSLQVEGYVGRQRYRELLSRCRAVIFPSLYEGYGIPVAEAVSAGKPILVSRGTVCEEIAGPLGVAVDGTDIESIAKGYERLQKFDISKYTQAIERLKRRYGDCEKTSMRLARLLNESVEAV